MPKSQKQKLNIKFQVFNIKFQVYFDGLFELNLSRFWYVQTEQKKNHSSKIRRFIKYCFVLRI